MGGNINIIGYKCFRELVLNALAVQGGEGWSQDIPDACKVTHVSKTSSEEIQKDFGN